jgi:hypothetical protein
VEMGKPETMPVTRSTMKKERHIHKSIYLRDNLK